MKIQPGTIAPSFSAVDLFGEPVSLEAYRGRTVLLSFFRNAACALCNLRVHHLIERRREYQTRGLEIVVVFESPAASLRRYVGTQDAPFPIVADPEATLYDLFGVESSQAKVTATMAMAETAGVVAQAAVAGYELVEEPDSNFLRMPADFVIGPDGTIVAAHYAQFVWDHLPFPELEELAGRTAVRLAA
jgi:peroxiredoxin